MKNELIRSVRELLAFIEEGFSKHLRWNFLSVIETEAIRSGDLANQGYENKNEILKDWSQENLNLILIGKIKELDLMLFEELTTLKRLLEEG